MYPIYDFHCTSCDFELPSGWGNYRYVEDDDGVRHPCRYPNEDKTITDILGAGVSDNLLEARTGYHHISVCLTCLHKFSLDPERDPRECPGCGSQTVETGLELVDKDCPNCGDGIFIDQATGLSPFDFFQESALDPQDPTAD